MKLSKQQYKDLCENASPKSQIFKDCVWAFVVGGIICGFGQLIREGWQASGMTLSDAGAMTSVTLIAMSAVATAFGWYQKLAAKAGAGTLVPITGFANAVVSPAIEFKAEGYVTGVAARMFLIAGPVLVYGLSASVIWGVIYFLLRPYV